MSRNKLISLFTIAVIGLSGCANLETWQVRQVVTREPKTDKSCILKTATTNNTDLTFVGVNSRFVLLNQSKVMVGEVSYFSQGTLLPGYEVTHTSEVNVSCNEIVDMKIVYLSLPVPSGYFHPVRILTEVK